MSLNPYQHWVLNRKLAKNARKKYYKSVTFSVNLHTIWLCNGYNYPFPFRNMTIDHIVPQNNGGTDVKENLQLLCDACNSTKGTRSQAEFLERLKQRGIIN